MTQTTTVPPTDLPAAVREYVAAHLAGDVETALRSFHADAVVVDEGHTYRGTEQIRGFLRDAGSEFTYTTELTGAERIDDEHWIAVHHLEGDFPGGVVDLRYRFTTAGGLIAELVIAP
ncbi:Ketosteroid isomerase homolog [Blastococcus fimeti]|nr:Ketosteroid isomerase homolog [Blastococcus fimeti]